MGLLFTQDEIAYLTRQFVDLYKSRQDKIAEDKFQQHQMKAARTMPEEVTHKPQIGKKTHLYAEKKHA